MLRSQIAGKNDSWASGGVPLQPCRCADALPWTSHWSTISASMGVGPTPATRQTCSASNIGDKDIRLEAIPVEESRVGRNAFVHRCRNMVPRRTLWVRCRCQIGRLLCRFHRQSPTIHVHAAPNASQSGWSDCYEVPLATFRRRNDRSRTYSLVICSFQASPLKGALARSPIRSSRAYGARASRAAASPDDRRSGRGSAR